MLILVTSSEHCTICLVVSDDDGSRSENWNVVGVLVNKMDYIVKDGQMKETLL